MTSPAWICEKVFENYISVEGTENFQLCAGETNLHVLEKKLKAKAVIPLDREIIVRSKKHKNWGTEILSYDFHFLMFLYVCVLSNISNSIIL